MIITCPHCRTRYQVAFETIGAAGRKVQCAECHKAWKAQADAAPPSAPARVQAPSPSPIEADTLFDATAETDLDDVFEAEAAFAEAPGRRSAAEQPSVIEAPLDPTLAKKRQHAFSRRQKDRNRTLPAARVRRVVRVGALLLLVGVVAGGYGLRTQIVRDFPDLAGAYAAAGLPINIVGLEFTDLTTQTRLQDGARSLTLSATIRSASDASAAVPRVMIALLDEHGQSLYEWSIVPEARRLNPGESLGIESRLADPPAGATIVRLAFLPQGAQAEPEAETAIEASPAAAHPPEAEPHSEAAAHPPETEAHSETTDHPPAAGAHPEAAAHPPQAEPHHEATVEADHGPAGAHAETEAH